jgi:hypothetical protein
MVSIFAPVTAVTVTRAVPVFVSLVAVIVAAPAPTPVTRPLAETVAKPVFDELHVTNRPVSVAPPASRVVAISCTVPPTVTLFVAGVTVTVATGAATTAVTTAEAVPVFVSLVAVIVAVPAPTAVTRPLADTVA